jgi:hypothetical protein
MKKIIIFLVIATCTWFGYQHIISNKNNGTNRSDKVSTEQLTKCITASGDVIYGRVPVGTVCQKNEKVGGALTIVPSLSEQKSNTPTSNLTSYPARCDGRTHCSQMTSCEEATFFLKNCPNTKMDGNNDGVPCEQQWCN